ncbi:hypothetical protein [Paenibacillus sp. yr247]|uniref:hypothetical protein n=1 Tax=Paenibacillus sp. yr247 TaxID=1761880 RepID=UPI000B82949E|nr:hypothetical protein [Paenibacillus sp. yr247]
MQEQIQKDLILIIWDKWNGNKPFSLASKPYNAGIGNSIGGSYTSQDEGAYLVYNLDSQYKHLTGVFGLMIK